MNDHIYLRPAEAHANTPETNHRTSEYVNSLAASVVQSDELDDSFKLESEEKYHIEEENYDAASEYANSLGASVVQSEEYVDSFKLECSQDHHTEDDNDDRDAELLALDKGYAWVIVLGGFLAQLLVGGLMRSNGVYYLQFVSKFKTNAQMSSWPGAVSFTIQGLSAPIGAVFCNRFSVRTCVILATVMNVSSLVMMAYSPNIYLLFLSYSFIGGLGRGLTLVPGIYIVNMYFDKYRGIAQGLATSGTGIGTVALVPLVDYLFANYGYKNGFLWISGMACVGFIIAALFRPLSMHVEMLKEKRKRYIYSRDSGFTSSHEPNLSQYGSVYLSHVEEDIHSSREAATKSLLDSQNYTDCELLIDECDKRTEKSKESPNMKSSLLGSHPTRKHWTKRANLCKRIVSVIFPIETHGRGTQKRRPLLHFALFKNIPFIVLCSSMTFFNLSQKTVFTFLPAIGEEKGFSHSQSSLVLSMTGLGDTIGRVLAGVIMDRPALIPHREAIYSLVLFLSAAAALCVPYMTSLPFLCLSGALFGAMMGASVSQKSTVLASLLGKETVNSAFGILYAFQGMGALTGPPLSGALKDKFHNYDVTFYVSSASMAMAGVLVALSAFLFAMCKQHQNPNRSSVDAK